MIKRNEEIKEIKKRVITSEECICDQCHNTIYIKKSTDIDNEYKYDWIANNPYEVTMGHRSWGNDSCDSIETKHICSDECAAAEFLNYVEKYSKEYNKAWIEFEAMN